MGKTLARAAVCAVLCAMLLAACDGSSESRDSSSSSGGLGCCSDSGSGPGLSGGGTQSGSVPSGMVSSWSTAPSGSTLLQINFTGGRRIQSNGTFLGPDLRSSVTRCEGLARFGGRSGCSPAPPASILERTSVLDANVLTLGPVGAQYSDVELTSGDAAGRVEHDGALCRLACCI